MMTTEEMWDSLVNAHGVSVETLQIVTTINGYNQKTMEDVLYAVAALRSLDRFDQVDDDDDDSVEIVDGPEACAGRGGHGDPRCGRRLGHTGPCDWVD